MFMETRIVHSIRIMSNKICYLLNFFRYCKLFALRMIDQSLVVVSIYHDAMMRLCIFLILFSRSTFDHNRSHLPLETITNDQ